MHVYALTLLNHCAHFSENFRNARNPSVMTTPGIKHAKFFSWLLHAKILVFTLYTCLEYLLYIVFFRALVQHKSVKASGHRIQRSKLRVSVKVQLTSITTYKTVKTPKMETWVNVKQKFRTVSSQELSINIAKHGNVKVDGFFAASILFPKIDSVFINTELRAHPCL